MGGTPIRLTRRGAAAALLAGDEYRGLLETVDPLRSPANAARLFAALQRALAEAGAPEHA